MGFSEHIAAYPDVAELFDRALASEKGLVLSFNTPAEATINAGRMNAYRVRLRRENAKIYPPGHALHNSTPYEGLMVRRKECEVRIEKLVVERFNVEEIK
jgi:hypothetical protein